MNISQLSISRFEIIAVAMSILLLTPSQVVFAASPVSTGTGFEISISDLNTVKKKAPAKRVRKGSASKKRSDAETNKSSSEAAAQSEPASQIATQPVESNSKIPDAIVSQKSSVATGAIQESGSTRILHSPYSYVVAGKRTIISAVIDSSTDIQEVNCSLRTSENGTRTLVKMVKANGTQFTYTATLPGLSPGIPALNYTIYAVDTQGTVTHSKEFVTLVKSSPFVPGWQIEGTDGTIPPERRKQSE